MGTGVEDQATPALLLDANIPVVTAERLAAPGLVIHDIRDLAPPGIADLDILEAARRLNALIVTRDFDFSDIREYPPGRCPGIIVLSVRNLPREAIIDVLRSLFAVLPLSELQGGTAIVEAGRCRIRRPSGETEERAFPVTWSSNPSAQG
mgnify:CR=1 FL=1